MKKNIFVTHKQQRKPYRMLGQYLFLIHDINLI